MPARGGRRRGTHERFALRRSDRSDHETRCRKQRVLVSQERRTFLQGAAFLGACGGLMGFGLTGCTPANTGGAAAQGWKAGTYSANVTGHNAPFTVDVTFSENAITAIDTSTNQESLGVGASALEDLSNKIMEYQTLNVDSVTGATLSSMSLQQGVKDCAEQANAAKTLAKAPGPDDSVESSYNADVCVVGGGGAGQPPSLPCKPEPTLWLSRNAASRADRRTSPKARSTQSIRNVSRSRESKTLSSSSTKSPMKEDTNRARPNSYTT